MTPEGRIKAKINKVLAQWEGVYKFMPVQQGLGATTLDYLICVNSHFLGIEAKAPGKKPTPRQLLTIQKIRDAGENHNAGYVECPIQENQHNEHCENADCG